MYLLSTFNLNSHDNCFTETSYDLNVIYFINEIFFYLVLPRLRLEMLPQYDFSIRRGDILNLKCSVLNPKSLSSLSNGSLVWLKDNQDNLEGISKIFHFLMQNIIQCLVDTGITKRYDDNFHFYV